MLGQILEGVKSKNISQNSKIMIRTKITSKSISHSNCFNQLLQKRPITLKPNPLKEICDTVYYIVYQTFDMSNIT